jgi:hypothetical protein
MKFNLRALVFTVGWLCFLSRPIQGAGTYFQVEYPAATAPNQLQICVTYRMWIPDGVARFRCVIVHQHGAGRTAAERELRPHTISTGRRWRRNGTARCSVPPITS